MMKPRLKLKKNLGQSINGSSLGLKFYKIILF